MSGDSQRNEEPDFLDDDFIIEDAVVKDDLEDLFEARPDAPKAEGAAPAGAAPKAAEDSDDVLFTDHTAGLHASASFQGGPPFAEGAPSTWQGEGLELEPNGVPVDDEAGTPVERGVVARKDAGLSDELDELLESDDELALDSEKELELVNAADAAVEGAAAAEMFVLDDEAGSLAATDAAPDGEAEPDEATAATAETADGDLPELIDEAAMAEPGWEPLPSAHVDQLAEVEEVAPAEDGADEIYGDTGTDEAMQEGDAGGSPVRRPALVGAGAPDAPEGHDVYVSDDAAQVVGGHRRAGGALRLVASLAASLAIVAGGAVAVMRPEWLGLHLEPDRVQQVQVARPKVEVAVPTPALPKAVVEAPAEPPKVVVTPPVQAVPTTPEVPVVTQPPVAQVPPGAQPTGEPPTPTPVPAETPPVATAPSVPVVVPVPSPTAGADVDWPVPKAAEPVALADKDRETGKAPSRLVRVTDEIMVGDQVEPAARKGTVEGVMPGSRAFAQLRNGNYFIGAVKTADAERITLRVGTGEVTLQVASITRLTELGSSDYEELQKVTSGFVRLTNNNRLVGGILSGIADDHVILEFRSNRVMLPKSAVGEVVQGENDAAIRLDTTREEDDWLRQLAERQLGTGAPPTPRQGAAPIPGGGSPR